MVSAAKRNPQRHCAGPRVGHAESLAWSNRQPRTAAAIRPAERFRRDGERKVNSPTGPRFTTQPLPDYRKRRIDEALARLSRATLEDMQALQYDVMSTQARELLPIFLATWRRAS